MVIEEGTGVAITEHFIVTIHLFSTDWSISVCGIFIKGIVSSVIYILSIGDML